MSFERVFGPTASAMFSLSFMLTGFALLYGVGFALRHRGRQIVTTDDDRTPLNTKIEQMLTEARVLLPGGQALLGFQFVATLTKSFHELPITYQYIHVVSLCTIALAVTLLMTPAALHRIAFQGDDDPQFYLIGSRLVILASCPLAAGIAADIAVVLFKVTESGLTSGLTALGSFFFVGTWLVYPAWRRMASKTASKESVHG